MPDPSSTSSDRARNRGDRTGRTERGRTDVGRKPGSASRDRTDGRTVVRRDTTLAPAQDARPAAPTPARRPVSTDGPGFADLGVPADLIDALVAMDRPTPFTVQRLTLADAIAGRDLCAKAPTGSGKTLAFAIPVALRTRRSKDNRPRALILLPTRELASQVAETLLPLARTRGLRVATVYGGTNINRDLTTLRRGVDVLVATPGRLADLVQRRVADLSKVDVVVLDEADRMADMGFLPEVTRLLDLTSDDRQTLLFSATLDGDVDTLVRRYQHDPVRHTVEEEPSSVGDVRHLFWAADRDARRRLTGDVVREARSAIVFTRTKHGADRLVKQLSQDGIPAVAIHGNRTQSQRERALESFRSGEITTLVATDVAARGIHVDAVEIVLHYDLAGSDKDYQHRSGRTGRAGADGLVVSFVDASQHKDTAAIQRSLALPEGLHATDVGQLRAAETPDVAVRFDTQERAAQRPRGGGRSSGAPAGRTRARGKGNGGAARAGGGGRSGGGGNAGSAGRSGGARRRSA
jgi:superfamily II DNA/RNA helicase